MTRSPADASGVIGGFACTVHDVAPGPVNCETLVPLHATPTAESAKAITLKTTPTCTQLASCTAEASESGLTA